MILADTSIWIDHFRSGNPELRKLLNEGQIVIHPFIVAELALGSLKQRTQTLGLLDRLPQARVAQLSEVRSMIETRRLYNLGIGLTDAHLIASTCLDPTLRLWTRDGPLRKAAGTLGIDVGLHYIAHPSSTHRNRQKHRNIVSRLAEFSRVDS